VSEPSKPPVPAPEPALALAVPAAPAEAVVDVGFLASIIDHVADPIFVKDVRYRWVLLNQAFCTMVGYPREQLLGKSDYDFFPASEAAFFRQKDVEMFSTAKEVVIEEEPITDAAGVRHVLRTTKVPLRGPDGQVTHLVGIIHDITRIKRAEETLRLSNEELERRVRERTAALEVAQAELVRTERLAVLGQLAGGLAHQIRNPLGAIMNASNVLRKALATHADPELRSAVGIILEEVWHANRIITDLLDYARVREPNRITTPVLSVVLDALAKQSVAANVIVEVAVPADLSASIDAEQVRDALDNLMRNALEAMADGGTLRLSAELDGGDVLVAVADTGPGIDPAVRDTLFEPLVTTKPLGRGLGLTTARALLENQGGSVRCVDSQHGACFEVRLPAVAGARAAT
jgi:PAS domain S-box-containing protein